MNDLIQNMKLNHLSFPSADTAATAQFFERYLGFTVSGVWQKSYILKRPGFDVVIDHAGDDVPRGRGRSMRVSSCRAWTPWRSSINASRPTASKWRRQSSTMAADRVSSAAHPVVSCSN